MEDDVDDVLGGRVEEGVDGGLMRQHYHHAQWFVLLSAMAPHQLRPEHRVRRCSALGRSGVPPSSSMYFGSVGHCSVDECRMPNGKWALGPNLDDVNESGIQRRGGVVKLTRSQRASW